MSAKKMLSETLDDLSSEELEEFKSLIELEKGFPLFSRGQLKVTNTQDIVELMVETHSQDCVELTEKILKKMNRTDLVQRFSDISSGTKEKHSVEEQRPSLIQRVETMTSVIELLLETFKDLNDRELMMLMGDPRMRILFYRHHLDFKLMEMTSTDIQDAVFSMVQTYGQQSVKKAMEFLKMMNRTDLVQKLSDSSSGPKKKHPVDEHMSALIHKVATMAAVKELLLETLSDLNHEELNNFKWFLQFTLFQRRLPQMSWTRLKWENLAEILVDVMMEKYGQQSVEVTREVLMDMNRTDMVQRLSETSSGPKDKHFVDEHWPALIQKVETMASVIELLLETLEDLSGEALEFRDVLLFKTDLHRRSSDTPWMLQITTNMQDNVFLMVQIYGQQSLQKTKEVLKEMKRTDLVQRLSDSSSGPKKKHSADEQRSALIQRVATIAAVKELLLETLNDLSNVEFKKFKMFLEVIFYQKDLPNIFRMLSFPADIADTAYTADTADTVDQMVQTFGQQSVELTRDAFMDMNRTDLVQRLSKPSSGLKEKHSVDELRRARIERAAAVEVVKLILLETLNDLSHWELEIFNRFLQFTCFQRSLPQISWRQPERLYQLVDLMVQSCGQQSVEVTKEVFMDMNRTDLVQKLSETSSKPKGSVYPQSADNLPRQQGGGRFSFSSDKHQPKLLQKGVTMASLQEKLLETLYDLSYSELEQFKWLLQNTLMKEGLPIIPRHRMEVADRAEIVTRMMEIYGQRSVEVTMKILEKMNRRDLVIWLSVISSGSKDKHTKVKLPRVPQRERGVTMTSLQEKLLETLEDLSDGDLEKFKRVLKYTKMKEGLPRISGHQIEVADRAEIVELMEEIYGQQSVEVTMKVLEEINRRDLVQRLSDISSGSKEKHSLDEHRRPLFERGATMTSLQKKLLETLEDLSDGDLEKFKHVLKYTKMNKGLPRIPGLRIEVADRVELVKLMEEIYGQQSVEVTMKVLEEINRRDLVQRLSDIRSESKEKHSLDEHRRALLEKGVTMTPLQEKLLETLYDLSNWELEQFRWLLQNTLMNEGLRIIPRDQMEILDRLGIVKLMEEIDGQRSVEVTMKVLEKINRRDLVQRLSDISSGSKGPPRSLELEGCGSTMQDSSDWTKLEPEVNSTDEDEAPTYSLQSERGDFECSISGLRWVSKEKVSFKYQFCSWEEPMKRMENIQYKPAGPLMDITVTAGKLDEVYLPHWICIDDDPKISAKFAVLHIDDCGDVVERVSEVTPSHVKLSEPIFSPRAVLIKAGIPLKINCNMLIYKTNTAFLTLHVYLIPRDPALQQTLDKRELSYGYQVIRKPHPEKSLKMRDRFILTADLDGAKISPENLKLRYESRDPNYFEVYIKNADKDFTLSLALKDESQPVWTREIREDEYRSAAHIQEKHSVDEHLSALMQKAATITPRERLWCTLGYLEQEEFKEFKWFLRDRDFLAGLPCIPRSRLEKGDMLDVVDLMLQTYSQQSVEVTMKVFKKINRNDLVQKLQDSSGSKASGSPA